MPLATSNSDLRRTFSNAAARETPPRVVSSTPPSAYSNVAQASDKAKSHHRSPSGLSAETKGTLGAYEETLSDDAETSPRRNHQDEEDEFDALVRSGETMKVSLTPSRLKTFDVRLDSTEHRSFSSHCQSSPNRRVPVPRIETPTRKDAPSTTALSRSSSASNDLTPLTPQNASSSRLEFPTRSKTSLVSPNASSRLIARGAATVPEQNHDDAPKEGGKEESLTELFASESPLHGAGRSNGHDQSAKGSARSTPRAVPAVILATPPSPAPATLPVQPIIANDLPSAYSARMSISTNSTVRASRSQGIDTELISLDATSTRKKTSAQELADFFTSTSPPVGDSPSTKSSKGLKSLISRMGSKKPNIFKSPQLGAEIQPNGLEDTKRSVKEAMARKRSIGQVNSEKNVIGINRTPPLPNLFQMPEQSPDAEPTLGQAADEPAKPVPSSAELIVPPNDEVQQPARPSIDRAVATTPPTPARDLPSRTSSREAVVKKATAASDAGIARSSVQSEPSIVLGEVASPTPQAPSAEAPVTDSTPQAIEPMFRIADLLSLRSLLQHATTAAECRILLSAVLTQWGVPLHPHEEDITPEDRIAAWLLAGREGPVTPIISTCDVDGRDEPRSESDIKAEIQHETQLDQNEDLSIEHALGKSSASTLAYTESSSELEDEGTLGMAQRVEMGSPRKVVAGLA